MKANYLRSSITLMIIGFWLIFVSDVVSQSPNLMSYQTVIRNTAGELVADQTVGVKLSVLQGSSSGTVVYAEVFTKNTNVNGLLSLELGSGTVLIGAFMFIDWTAGPYFLQTDIDPEGGTAYTITSVTQFLSVPYSMYAEKSGSSAGTAGGDLSGTYPDPVVVKIQSLPVSNATPAANEALLWNGTQWTPGPTVFGSAGGDLSGTYPNPTVAQIQSKPVSPSAPATNDALIWNGTQWTPTASSGLGTNYWTLNGSGQIYNNNTGGLVGIGNNAPSYKLDVLHGGSTGARIASSSSFSVVDIDASTGDAALRFAKAGVNQWNIRNRPADDYLEIFELGGGGSRFVIQDGTGNVGIGETTSPSYKLDVLHSGSTGIRSRSSASFSVVDIDASTGDAALRFAKAGVNQWNTRNRPADDYYEIFELGGGGSRFVIQDGTGNVGIGETTSPSYKLDVLHGGSTGIRSRSSASFSVVDIDGASGDAALRFAKAGVNQWNIRNRPADDYLEIFELGGGGSRMVIQDGTGNVGIGETVSPSYKLDVLHSGATGIRSRSSSTFSVVDIDGSNGDAALRFAKAGVNQWNVRNNPATDDLQIFELGGGGERMRIENTTGLVVVSGDFTCLGTKAFTMDHPLDPENRVLVHAAIESNEVINSYSGNVITDANGNATVTLPEYFEAINKDYRYQLTVIGTFAQAIISKEISNNSFEIKTNLPDIKVSWEVKGVRNDLRMQKHPFVAEREKPDSQKGKYMDPESYNQAQSKNVNFDGNSSGISSLNFVAPVDKKMTSKETGGSIEDVVKPQVKSKPADISGSVADTKPQPAPKKTEVPVGKSSIDE